MALLATESVIPLENDNPELVRICAGVAEWKKDTWKLARSQLLNYLPAIIFQHDSQFVMISTAQHDGFRERFWAARLSIAETKEQQSPETNMHKP